MKEWRLVSLSVVWYTLCTGASEADGWLSTSPSKRVSVHDIQAHDPVLVSFLTLLWWHTLYWSNISWLNKLVCYVQAPWSPLSSNFLGHMHISSGVWEWFITGWLCTGEWCCQWDLHWNFWRDIWWYLQRSYLWGNLMWECCETTSILEHIIITSTEQIFHSYIWHSLWKL